MHCIYKHMMVEMFLRGLNGKQLADKAGIGYHRFRRAMTGAAELTLADALLVKHALGSELPVEYLFATE